MKNIFLMIIALFLAFSCFSQTDNVSNMIWGCIRDTKQPDVLGTLSEAKTQGWVLWTSTSDEFNLSTLDRTKWQVAGDNGIRTCIGMSPFAYFRDDPYNVKDTNGRLVLRVKHDTIYPCPDDDQPLSTGWIGSNASFHYGLIQLRCKIPSEISLEPSFWTMGEEWDVRYDEIDVFEKMWDERSNRIFRQNILKKLKSTITDTISDMECKVLEYPTAYTSSDFILTLEWLPKEINFYVNGHWSNGFKYTTDPSSISPTDSALQLPRSVFTCVDFTNACPQHIELSLSLRSDTPQDITQGFEVDWIRSYKLLAGMPDYHPQYILLSDPELSKVHSTVIFGGTNNGVVPVNSSITVWASNSITLDKGFTLSPGCTFELRRIDTASDLLISNGSNEETD